MAECKGLEDVKGYSWKRHERSIYIDLFAADTSRDDVGAKITYWDWPGLAPPIQGSDPDRVKRTVSPNADKEWLHNLSEGGKVTAPVN